MRDCPLKRTESLGVSHQARTHQVSIWEESDYTSPGREVSERPDFLFSDSDGEDVHLVREADSSSHCQVVRVDVFSVQHMALWTQQLISPS